MKYTIDYFIQKFQAIPEEYWIINSYIHWSDKNLHCALGHCKVRCNRSTNEGSELEAIFNSNGLQSVANVNDGVDRRFQQPTPKQRIIAALLWIKSRQPVEISNPPITIEDLVKEPVLQSILQFNL